MSGKKYELPNVDYSSDLVRFSFDLERLRGNLGIGTTPDEVFADLHALFQLLMGVVSARIEGNRTTVYEAVRGTSGDEAPTDSLQEILNILRAIEYVDAAMVAGPVTQTFIRDLHRLSVQGLIREGDPNPGSYRDVDVEITKAAHTPPSHLFVHSEMSELLEFVNRDMHTYEQLMHVAIAHHRFLWIHPFRNGNGRVSRLLSYAMLRRHGVVSPYGYRAVNPTAVFGNDRDGYYTSLAAADDLSNDGTVAWCTFFVQGIHGDVERLTRLQDFSFVSGSLVAPALESMVAAGAITAVERDVVALTFQQRIVKAGDLATILTGSPSARSRAIAGLLERNILQHHPSGQRFYSVSLSASALTPFIVRRLDALGFLPAILQDDDFRR